MTPKIRSVGRGPAGRRYLSSDRELRLGVCFWFRLFHVVPETTARFSYLDDRSRNQSPPCNGTPLIDVTRPPFYGTGDPVAHTGLRGLLAVPAAPLLGGPGGLALGVPGHDHVALVVEPASLGQGQFHLRPPVAEVQLGRNEGQGLLLGLPHQLVDLGPVDQQLALPVRVVGTEPGGVLPGRDVEL